MVSLERQSSIASSAQVEVLSSDSQMFAEKTLALVDQFARQVAGNKEIGVVIGGCAG